MASHVLHLQIQVTITLSHRLLIRELTNATPWGTLLDNPSEVRRG